MKWADFVAMSRIVFTTLLAILAFSGIANAQTIVGNSVTYSNEWGTITQSPHTLKDFQNTVYINVTSNLAGTNYIDSFFGFNSQNAKPVQVSAWTQNVPHTVPVTGLVNESQTVLCLGNLAGIINTTHVWCYYALNASNQSISCPAPRVFPTNFSCSFNYSVSRVIGETTQYYDDWVDVGSLFKKADYNGKTYYYVENVSFVQGQMRQLKATVSVKPNTNGKYDMLLKRTSDSIQSAFIDKTVPAVILDPWWNATWTYKAKIQMNSTTATSLDFFPARLILDTNALITAGKMNGTCKDLRIVDSTETLLLPYEIENNTCNKTYTTVWFSINLTNGIGAGQANTTAYLYYGAPTVADGQNPHTLWNQSGYIRVYHFGETSWGNSVTRQVEESSQYADHGGTGSAAPVPFQNATSKFGYSAFYGTTTPSPGTYINWTNTNSWTAAAGTFEIWAWNWDPAQTGTKSTGLYSSYASISAPYGSIAYIDGTNKTVFWTRDGASTARSAPTAQVGKTWSLVTTVNNGTHTGAVYLNATIKASGSTGTSETDGFAVCGIGVGAGYVSGNAASPQNWIGFLDEFRVSAATKTDDWIKANFQLASSLETETINTVSDTVPTASLVTLLNNSVGTALGTTFKSNPINYNASGNCSDLENNTMTGNFTFYINTTKFATYQTTNWVVNKTNYTTTALSGLNKSDNLKVGLTCYDGGLWGVEVNSSAITVNNTAPAITAPSIASNEAGYYGTSMLTCTNGTYSDVDSDAKGIGYWRWFLNGTAIAGNTTQTINNSIVKGNISDVFICEYMTEDTGYNLKNSTRVNSSQVTIESSLPTITFVSQFPADLNITNAQSNPVKLNYSVTGSALNATTVELWYKANSTTSNTMYFQNGTAHSGYFKATDIVNASENYTWTLLDNQIYPGTFNIGPVSVDGITHTGTTTSNANDYVLTEYLNVSGTKQWGYFEIMATSTAGANPSRLYYCNSTYTTGNILTSPNCGLVSTRTATTAYDHCHLNASCHIGFQFAANITAQTIGGIKVTSKSNFVFGGAAGWTYQRVASIVRPQMTNTTANRGITWTNQAYTVDEHLHQFDNSENQTFYYYVCANDTFGNQACSAVRQDIMEIGGLAPTSPDVYSPAEGGSFDNSTLVNINYTEALSPNAYAISFYNISLLNNDFSFNKTVYTNNSLNLSYAWNISGTAVGSYIVSVKATDINGLSSIGYSGEFNITLPNTAPTVNTVTLCNGTACSALGTLYVNSNTLNCSANITDTTNATISQVLFRVYRNSTLYAQYITYGSANNSLAYLNTTIPASALKKSDTWRCEASAFDGLLNSTGLNSTGATVNNTAPATTSAISSNEAGFFQTSILTCSGIYSDADGDAQGALRYRWFLNNTILPNTTVSIMRIDSGFNITDNMICERMTEDSGYGTKNSTRTNSSIQIIYLNNNAIPEYWEMGGGGGGGGATCIDYTLVGQCSKVSIGMLCTIDGLKSSINCTGAQPSNATAIVCKDGDYVCKAFKFSDDIKSSAIDAKEKFDVWLTGSTYNLKNIIITLFIGLILLFFDVERSKGKGKDEEKKRARLSWFSIVIFAVLVYALLVWKGVI